MGTLNGKNALVTGASRGIGRAVARRLAAEGARVAVHYGRDAGAAAATVGLIEEAGGRAFTVQATFGGRRGAEEGRGGGPDGVDRLFAGLAAELAGERLDIVVNNAGIASATSIGAMTPEELDRLFAINVDAPFFVIQRALPVMNDGGRIINIGSVASRMAVSTQIGYTLTKAALEALAPSLANELGGRGITVNTVAPGVIRTELIAVHMATPEAAAGVTGVTALGRLGEPEDVADAVAFLAGPDARWITGRTLDVSGGTYLGPIIPAA